MRLNTRPYLPVPRPTKRPPCRTASVVMCGNPCGVAIRNRMEGTLIRTGTRVRGGLSGDDPLCPPLQIQSANVIFVIEAGRLVEQGDHAQVPNSRC